MSNRVIDNHSELVGVGTTTHALIDQRLNAAFAVVSGSVGAPPNARLIVAGGGMQILDTGTNLVFVSTSSLGPTGPSALPA